jgi:L-lactate dehydrogenase complex protein LldG
MLGRVRAALGAVPAESERRASVGAWLASPPHAGLLPAPARLAPAAVVDAFVARLKSAAAMVEILAEPSDVAGAVARALRARTLEPSVVARNDSWLMEILRGQGVLAVRTGPATTADAASVVLPSAGAAETGTLVFASGPGSPASLNFLPDLTIAIVPRSRVVASYEQALDMVRAEGRGLPRIVNFVTGPSRTADIEEVIQLGAHGPRELLVLLVERA